jgi:hypothetical protein
MPIWTTDLTSNVYLQLTTSENPNPGNNSSTVNWSLDLVGHNYAYNGFSNYWYAQIDGTTVGDGYRGYSFGGGWGTINLGSGTTWWNIGHNADGSKSIGVVGYYDENGNTISQTMTLTDFVRVPSAPSSVVPVVNANKTITVTANGVSSPLTATYWYAYQQGSGAWSSPVSSSSNTYTYSGLTPGANYTFRVYATSTEGTGGTTTSSSVFLPSGGKIYTGTAWVPTTVAKIYTGTAWVPITTAKIYTGTSWVNLN